MSGHPPIPERVYDVAVGTYLQVDGPMAVRLRTILPVVAEVLWEEWTRDAVVVPVVAADGVDEGGDPYWTSDAGRVEAAQYGGVPSIFAVGIVRWLDVDCAHALAAHLLSAIRSARRIAAEAVNSDG